MSFQPEVGAPVSEDASLWPLVAVAGAEVGIDLFLFPRALIVPHLCHLPLSPEKPPPPHAISAWPVTVPARSLLRSPNKSALQSTPYNEPDPG